MLSKSHRLTKKEFQDVYKKKVFFTPFFVVHVLFPVGGVATKFSVVVSKKIAKTAVLRNSVKRKYYITLENFINEQVKSVWCVIFVNKNGTMLETPQIHQELERVMKTIQKHA